MDPDTEINFREEIVRIVQFLVETFCRIREGDEDFFILRWRAACLRRNSRHKSVVRWFGDSIPRVNFGSYELGNYKTFLGSIFNTRRSFVRDIGNRLPLQPSKRPYFYMLHKPHTAVAPLMRSNAVGASRFVHSTPCRNSISPGCAHWEGGDESCQANLFSQSSVMAPDDTVRKITALEDELNRLRAQIAGFVLNQEEPAAMIVGQQAVVPPPPPPPPPPLPLPVPSSMPSLPVCQEQQQKSTSKPALVRNGLVMDMSTILKDLNQVKLKAVQRSPGGTPVRRTPRQTKGTDPASIIAAALKSKFAKSRVAVASPDKENIHSMSPGNSFGNTPSPQPCFRRPLQPKQTQSIINTENHFQEVKQTVVVSKAKEIVV